MDGFRIKQIRLGKFALCYCRCPSQIRFSFPQIRKHSKIEVNPGSSGHLYSLNHFITLLHYGYISFIHNNTKWHAEQTELRRHYGKVSTSCRVAMVTMELPSLATMSAAEYVSSRKLSVVWVLVRNWATSGQGQSTRGNLTSVCSVIKLGIRHWLVWLQVRKACSASVSLRLNDEGFFQFLAERIWL